MLSVEEAWHTKDSDLVKFHELRHTSLLERPAELKSVGVYTREVPKGMQMWEDIEMVLPLAAVSDLCRSTLKDYRSDLVHFGRGAGIDKQGASFSDPFIYYLLY